MKNHMFFGYSGNKRNEVHKIVENIKLRNIKTVVEPFCGTCALSYYLSTLYPLKYKYKLNDVDNNLIELYNIAKDPLKLKAVEDEINLLIIDLDKLKYKEIIKGKSMASFIIKNKIYSIRPGLFPLDYKHKNINLMSVPIVKFLQTENIELSNIDGLTIYKSNMDDKNTLIFLDPPYMDSCNDFYTSKESNTNIYEYLYYNPISNKEVKAEVVLCLENNWIIKMLFAQSSKTSRVTYDKHYELSKRDTQHIIINNRVVKKKPAVIIPTYNDMYAETINAPQ